MRFAVTLIALALVVSPHPCAAREGGVTLQFVSFPRLADPEPVELRLGEGKTIEVRIPSNELSAPYRVTRHATWAVGKTGEDDRGKPAFTVYGKAKALSSPKQLLLLIRKGPTNADGFRIIPFDNRAAQFGGRQFLFLNASKTAIAGEVGTRKFTLKSGDHAIVRPKATQGDNLCHASLFYRKEKNWKAFFSSNWPLRDDARGLIFIYNDPRSSRLRLHTIRDFL